MSAPSLAGARSLAFVAVAVLFWSLMFPLPAEAQGIAMSGNFNRQHFELIPGQSVTTPDIYAIVFNRGEQDMKVKVVPQSPVGVELVLPATDFTLPPGQSRQIQVGVRVGTQVAPGDYDLILTIESYREGEGIKLAGAAQQQARLTIIAESGEVDISQRLQRDRKLQEQTHARQLLCGSSSPGQKGS